MADKVDWGDLLLLDFSMRRRRWDGGKDVLPLERLEERRLINRGCLEAYLLPLIAD